VRRTDGHRTARDAPALSSWWLEPSTKKTDSSAAVNPWREHMAVDQILTYVDIVPVNWSEAD
jgi:hypothetical protein